MGKPLDFVFTNSPKIFLLVLFTYECYFNKGTLYVTFYYLPFYFFIEIYKHTSTTLQIENIENDRITSLLKLLVHNNI